MKRRSFPIGGGIACALILCGGSVAAERGAPAVNPGYDWATGTAAGKNAIRRFVQFCTGG